MTRRTSRTSGVQTFGQFLVNEALPDDLRTSGPVTKKDLYGRIYTMARRDPADAAKRIDQLRVLGHELATLDGISIGLDDIAPDPRKFEITKPAMLKIQQTDDPVKRRELILDAEDKLLKLTPQHPGTQGELVRSGGRGAPIQLMRMANAQVHGRDPATGDIYPWFVPRSMSEGLKPSESWVANAEARTNAIAAGTAISEPGALSKVIVNNMSDQLVLEEDCGTQNGVMMRTEDPNIMDRYLARAESGFPKDTLVTPQVATRLRSKAEQVMIRSPMTCELNAGVCQKCYGLNENGKLHALGTNVGVRSAQALGEPITQFIISSRHGVRGASSDKKKVEGLQGIRQMLEIPNSFLHKASLATEAGTVKSVERAPQGGFNIYVGEQTYYVPPGLSPIVREGQKVNAGDALSDGIPKPDEVVQFKGLGAGRKYLVDRLNDIYQDRGLNIDKRHLELLARSHLNFVRVDRDPGDRFLPGEIVNYTTLMRNLADDIETIPVHEAVGKVLAAGALHHVAGTTITPDIAADLTKNRISTVRVSRKPPTVSFIMRPIVRNPLLNPDWMARLGHQYLRESILEGAHVGQVSNIHGTHPVPAYIYGTEFGKGPKGRY